MADKTSIPALGWIVTVMARRPRQRSGTAEMWIAMYADAHEAITAVTRKGVHTDHGNGRSPSKGGTLVGDRPKSGGRTGEAVWLAVPRASSAPSPTLAIP